jgi:nitroreductase/dihydropteridine reductase
MQQASFFANKRYTTKAFDPDKKISDAQIEEIKQLLRLSPSSTNSQPWHFVLAASEAGKAKIAEATSDFAFNTQKILNASHVLVLCSKTTMDDAHILKVLEQEDSDGRFSDDAAKQANNNGRTFFANIHRYELKDSQHWMEKQVYLALGNLLLGASLLDIDTCPIEGFNATTLNQVLDLPAKGYTATVIVALGYHSEEDFNAKLPKSRLPISDIFTEI